jgi:hypothetical protein
LIDDLVPEKKWVKMEQERVLRTGFVPPLPSR